MAHVGKEFGLAAVRQFGLLQGVTQLLLVALQFGDIREDLYPAVIKGLPLGDLKMGSAI